MAASTAAPGASIAIDNIVLSSGAKQLQVSVQANAATFTSPGSSTTWSAADVTWNAPSWSAATGSAGTLSYSASNVAQCSPGVSSCSTSGLVFRSAPNTGVTRSGSHTIVVSWKFESIGS